MDADTIEPEELLAAPASADGDDDRQLVISPEAVRAARATTRRQVSSEELRAALETPIPASEAEEVLALRAWFMRRYPNVGDRLAYVGRAYRAWTAHMPPEPRDD